MVGRLCKCLLEMDFCGSHMKQYRNNIKQQFSEKQIDTKWSKTVRFFWDGHVPGAVFLQGVNMCDFLDQYPLKRPSS